MKIFFCLALLGLYWSARLSGGEAAGGALQDPGFFPLCVWVQDPANAERYKAAGINVFIGLWAGPTEEQFEGLKKAGMRMICDQNAVGLKHKDDPLILAWMHGDEPDNAQSLPDKKGYGPPVEPKKIEEDYAKVRLADPSRPVVLNLGQGVAWDGWHGRGVRTNHPEDYPEYVKGCDIASFDIYPACHTKPEVAGKLWFVAQGVERLVKWTAGKKPVWCCIECTHISNPDRKATPHEVRCEVWMALTHGARGLIYFCHEFKPKFIEAGMLADAEMTRAIGELNKQILELAPVLNAPAAAEEVQVASSKPDVPVKALLKRHGAATYLFTVGMRDGATRATFTLPGMKGAASAEVLGENRTLSVQDGVLADDFQPWDVHLYKLAGKP